MGTQVLQMKNDPLDIFIFILHQRKFFLRLAKLLFDGLHGIYCDSPPLGNLLHFLLGLQK